MNVITFLNSNYNFGMFTDEGARLVKIIAITAHYKKINGETKKNCKLYAKKELEKLHTVKGFGEATDSEVMENISEYIKFGPDMFNTSSDSSDSDEEIKHQQKVCKKPTYIEPKKVCQKPKKYEKTLYGLKKLCDELFDTYIIVQNTDAYDLCKIKAIVSKQFINEKLSWDIKCDFVEIEFTADEEGEFFYYSYNEIGGKMVLESMLPTEPSHKYFSLLHKKLATQKYDDVIIKQLMVENTIKYEKLKSEMDKQQLILDNIDFDNNSDSAMEYAINLDSIKFNPHFAQVVVYDEDGEIIKFLQELDTKLDRAQTYLSCADRGFWSKYSNICADKLSTELIEEWQNANLKTRERLIPLLASNFNDMQILLFDGIVIWIGFSDDINKALKNIKNMNHLLSNGARVDLIIPSVYIKKEAVKKEDIRYPNLSEYVNNYIVPPELQGMSQVINKYIDLILLAIKEEVPTGLDYIKEDAPIGLDYFIFHCCPFPGWCDKGNMKIINHGNDQLKGREPVTALRIALQKDGIIHNIPDGEGF